MTARDAWLFTVGLVFLTMAKAKHVVQGYRTPKTFDASDVYRSLVYDERVVEDWLTGLEQYTGRAGLLTDKTVLELGPGSDLGVGILLLARGARQYSACDVHDLVSRTAPAFYERLFEKLSQDENQTRMAELRQQWLSLRQGAPSRLNYVVQPTFDLPSAVGIGTVDLVFSQAAFEHFDDIDDVVRQISQVCRFGARLVAEIDLKTHSRWIRDVDPNNIYRYPDFIYKAFYFRGIPNRVRPYQYRAALEKYGWADIKVIRAAKARAHHSTTGLSARFRDPANEMECLSVMLCATKAERG